MSTPTLSESNAALGDALAEQFAFQWATLEEVRANTLQSKKENPSNIHQDKRKVFIRPFRDKKLSSALEGAAVRGESGPAFGDKQANGPCDFQLPPLHPRDTKKLLRYPEPSRTSKWIRMSLVACNGSALFLEELYTKYHDFFESLVLENAAKTTIASNKRRTHKSLREGQPTVRHLEEEQEREEHPQEVQPTDKQQIQAEHPQMIDSKRQSASQPPATLVTRLEVLRILSSAIHGILIFSPDGRVRSWSAKDVARGSKLMVMGVCTRTTALTFPSTNRERNLRQLRYYKDKGDIVYPEGDPAKTSTFLKWLAHDPLFILPKETGPPLHQRQMRDPAWYDGKATEDPAFPGVCLNKKKFFMAGNKLGASALKSKSGKAMAKNTSGTGPEADLSGRRIRNGKQKQELHEPQENATTTGTLASKVKGCCASCTDFKRKIGMDGLANMPQKLSDALSTLPSLNAGTKAVAINVGSAREFSRFVERYRPRIVMDYDDYSEGSRQLVKKLDELWNKAKRTR